MAGSPYFSPGLAATVAHTLDQVMGFTYTRIPMTRPSQPDGWGRRDGTPGTPVSGEACRYVTEVRLLLDAGGRVISYSPDALRGGDQGTADVLTVTAASHLQVGDQVANILRADGSVALAGPVLIESEIPSDTFGRIVQKSFVLRGQIDEVPA